LPHRPSLAAGKALTNDRVFAPTHEPTLPAKNFVATIFVAHRLYSVAGIFDRHVTANDLTVPVGSAGRNNDENYFRPRLIKFYFF
jgi:hypothetical protein